MVHVHPPSIARGRPRGIVRFSGSQAWGVAVTATPVGGGCRQNLRTSRRSRRACIAHPCRVAELDGRARDGTADYQQPPDTEDRADYGNARAGYGLAPGTVSTGRRASLTTFAGHPPLAPVSAAITARAKMSVRIVHPLAEPRVLAPHRDFAGQGPPQPQVVRRVGLVGLLAPRPAGARGRRRFARGGRARSRTRVRRCGCSHRTSTTASAAGAPSRGTR